MQLRDYTDSSARIKFQNSIIFISSIAFIFILPTEIIRTLI